jgi:hypothetical protein
MTPGTSATPESAETNCFACSEKSSVVVVFCMKVNQNEKKCMRSQSVGFCSYAPSGHRIAFYWLANQFTPFQSNPVMIYGSAAAVPQDWRCRNITISLLTAPRYFSPVGALLDGVPGPVFLKLDFIAQIAPDPSNNARLLVSIFHSPENLQYRPSTHINRGQGSTEW